MLEFVFGILGSETLSYFIAPGLFLGVLLIAAGQVLPSVFAQYKIPAQLAGIALVLFFTFQAGVYKTEAIHKQAEAELRLEIAELKATSNVITKEVEIRYIDRVKTVEKVKVEYVTQIEKIVDSVADSRCVIPNGFVRVFNSSIEGKLPGTPIESDAAPSGIALSDVSQVTSENNLTVIQIREQLIQLQTWITAQQELYNKK